MKMKALIDQYSVENLQMKKLLNHPSNNQSSDDSKGNYRILAVYADIKYDYDVHLKENKQKLEQQMNE